MTLVNATYLVLHTVFESREPVHASPDLSRAIYYATVCLAGVFISRVLSVSVGSETSVGGCAVGHLDVEADAVGASAAGKVDTRAGVTFELAADGGASGDTALRLALALQTGAHGRAGLSGRRRPGNRRRGRGLGRVAGRREQRAENRLVDLERALGLRVDQVSQEGELDREVLGCKWSVLSRILYVTRTHGCGLRGTCQTRSRQIERSRRRHSTRGEASSSARPASRARALRGAGAGQRSEAA